MKGLLGCCKQLREVTPLSDFKESQMMRQLHRFTSGMNKEKCHNKSFVCLCQGGFLVKATMVCLVNIDCFRKQRCSREKRSVLCTRCPHSTLQGSRTELALVWPLGQPLKAASHLWLSSTLQWTQGSGSCTETTAGCTSEHSKRGQQGDSLQKCAAIQTKLPVQLHPGKPKTLQHCLLTDLSCQMCTTKELPSEICFEWALSHNSTALPAVWRLPLLTFATSSTQEAKKSNCTSAALWLLPLLPACPAEGLGCPGTFSLPLENHSQCWAFPGLHRWLGAKKPCSTEESGPSHLF